MALATTGRIHHACMDSVRAMIRSTCTAEHVALWWDVDQPHDRCRNALLRRFLTDRTWTHIFFVDSDEVVEPDTLDRLLAHDEALVCGPVPTLHQRYGPPTEQKGVTIGTNIMVHDKVALRGSMVPVDAPDMGYRRMDPDQFPGHPFYCDASGLGLCLIRRDVIEHMEPPWCAFVGHETAGIGEDVYFFRKARAAGFRLLVDPTVMADHYKVIDLTHLDLLYTEKLPISPWPRMARRFVQPAAGESSNVSVEYSPDVSLAALHQPSEHNGHRPVLADRMDNHSLDHNGHQAMNEPVVHVLVALMVPSTGWLHARTMDTLHHWEKQWGGRICVRTFHADTLRGGMLALADQLAGADAGFTHVLLVRDDVVPHPDVLGLLVGIDSPIVGALSRRLIDGRICWAYWNREPATGAFVAPQNIRLPEIEAPFPVDAVDPACALIRREALKCVPEAVQATSVAHDADDQFIRHWCGLVSDRTGAKPLVAPVTVERRSEVGLRGFLDIKMKLKQSFINATSTNNPAQTIVRGVDSRHATPST